MSPAANLPGRITMTNDEKTQLLIQLDYALDRLVTGAIGELGTEKGITYMQGLATGELYVRTVCRQKPLCVEIKLFRTDGEGVSALIAKAALQGVEPLQN
jgi:hypothetical protein